MPTSLEELEKPAAPPAVPVAQGALAWDDSQPVIDVELDLRRILWKTLLSIVLIVLVVGGLGYLFREPLKEISHWFVDHLGGLGVALGFMLPDGFMVPLPNDAFSFFGLTGGMDFWAVVAWGSAGSLAGGSIGLLIGRLLRRTRRFRLFMRQKGAEVRALVRRYGSWALAIGAATPVPYSICCWACGAGGMGYGRFFVISLLRIPRVALYLYLLDRGFVSMV